MVTQFNGFLGGRSIPFDRCSLSVGNFHFNRCSLSVSVGSALEKKVDQQRCLMDMLAEVNRSIVLPDGIVTAHSDRTLMFRMNTPTRGREQRIWLPAMATSLLACRGPQERSWRLVVGDKTGTVRVYTLPRLELLNSHELGESQVTALSLHDPDRHERILVGMQNGEVHAIGERLPGGSMLLFDIGQEVGLIRSSDEIITIHSGWKREVRHWDGDAVSPAERWQIPPNPPKRNRRQLTLATAVPV